VHLDQPESREYARRTVAKNLPVLTKAGRWLLMDGGQMVRPEAVVAIQAVIGEPTKQHAISFSLAADEDPSGPADRPSTSP
jgi:hypothetical protein